MIGNFRLLNLMKIYNPFIKAYLEFDLSSLPAVLVENTETAVPFYDMSALNGITLKGKMVEFVTSFIPKEEVVDFVVWVSSLFFEYHSNRWGSREYMQGLARESCVRLFDRYVEKCTSPGEDDHRLVNLRALEWCSITNTVIWKVFLQFRRTKNPFNEEKGTWALLREMSDSLINSYTSYIYHPYAILRKLIPYNFWGDDYNPDLIDVSLPLSAVEQPQIDFMANIELFSRKIEEFLSEVGKGRRNEEVRSSLEKVEDLLISLLRDYTRRLVYQPETPDERVICGLVNNWQEMTSLIIHRCYTLSSGDFSIAWDSGYSEINVPTIDGDQDSTPEKTYRATIHLLNKVRRICDQYIVRIKRDGIPQSWEKTLRELGIDYDKLYNWMEVEGDMFLSFRKKAFVRSFYFADFADLLNAVRKHSGSKRDGHVGFIKFMISELGDNLDKKWLTKAAESISSKKGSEAIAEIRAHSDGLFVKQNKAILSECCKNYKERIKRERDKQ